MRPCPIRAFCQPAGGTAYCLVKRVVLAFSDAGEHVVDPFLGAGSTLIACSQTGRRSTGADLDPQAVRFSAARLPDAHAWPEERQPRLLDLPAA